MKATHPQESSGPMRLLATAWFSVTFHERLAILTVLGLFLLGLGARAWHLSRVHDPARPPAPVSVPEKP